MESVYREREGVCFEIEGAFREIESACKGSGREYVCVFREKGRVYREMESVCREREGVSFEIEREGVCVER